MEGAEIQDFLLLQMADSAFPTGAFAYSSGLEAMAEFGLFDDEQEMADYIYEFSRQIMAFELPFLNSFFELSENGEELKEAALAYDATFVSAGMYEASVNLGKNWMRILDEIIRQEERFLPLKSFLKEAQLPPHFLLVSVLSLKVLGFPRERISTFFLSSIIRDQVSAAIRLGIAGPMEGHTIQYMIYAELAGKLSLLQEKRYPDAWRTGFMPDVAQMLQKNVYSKLFKN